MDTLALVQGTKEWHEHRLSCDNASESAAMLGLDKNTTRDELIHMVATGDEKEFSDYVKERIFKPGHEVEAMARVIIEQEIGEDLYTVTGVKGLLSASFDGLTMLEDEDIAFEHKQWNEELAALVAQGIVPDTHMPQLQQQLMVSEAKKVIFVVSDGTKEKREKVEVFPDPVWFERIRAGWVQFHKDIEDYTPQVEVVKPTANVIETLPALVVHIDGVVKSSNLAAYKKTALAFIDDIKTDLKTDQDFADAASTITFCTKAEKELDLIKKQALGQTATISELFNTMDTLKENMRKKRLELNSIVTAKKKEIRGSILFEAQSELKEHIISINKRVMNYMPEISADFASAMKGKKTVNSLRSACNDLLATTKITANATADSLEANLKIINELGEGYSFLLNDVAQIIHKDADDLTMLINARIAEHKQAEEKRLEAEREQIRKEEEAKAAAKAEEEAKRIQAEREQIRKEEEAKAAAKAAAKAEEEAKVTAEAAKEAVHAQAPDQEKPDEPQQVQPETTSKVVPLPSKAPAQQPVKSLMEDIAHWCDAWCIPAGGCYELTEILKEHMPEQATRKA